MDERKENNSNLLLLCVCVIWSLSSGMVLSLGVSVTIFLTSHLRSVFFFFANRK